MIMKYVKQEQVMEAREYSIDIDENYLKSITEKIKADAADPDEVPDITFDLLHAAVYDEEEFDITIMVKGYFGDTYEASLLGLIKDIIDDDAWDTDYTVVDAECCDCVDTLE